jgi:tetratricopeptide (TPR) repeat protein
MKRLRLSDTRKPVNLWPLLVLVTFAGLGLSMSAIAAAEGQQAAEFLSQAAVLAEEADQLLQQGIQQFNNGQTQAALETFERELALRRQLNDQEGEWRSFGWIGRIYRRQGQWLEALELYQVALGMRI